jgi:N-acetyl-anhydromuramyl-L-alanine amidase AmpD
MKRKIKFIVVHHSVSRWGCAKVINAWHTDKKPKGNGWGVAGYHYVINNGYPHYRDYSSEKRRAGWDGKIEKLVPESDISNGVLAFNRNLINVCLVGDFDNEGPTAPQINALEVLCTKLLKKYNLSPESIIGHCDAISLREHIEGKQRSDHGKSCPGFFFMDENMGPLLDDLGEWFYLADR